jgi:hypothetical protein
LECLKNKFKVRIADTLFSLLALFFTPTNSLDLKRSRFRPPLSSTALSTPRPLRYKSKQSNGLRQCRLQSMAERNCWGEREKREGGGGWGLGGRRERSFLVERLLHNASGRGREDRRGERF